MKPLFTKPAKCAALLIIKRRSVRVPGKNFRPLGGKPLFHWIVDTLLSIRQIDRIIIDTDARAELVKGGLVENERLILRDRPAALRGDDVTANTLLKSLLPVSPARLYLMTHVTNPFLSARTVGRALSAYRAAVRARSADSLVTVNEHRTRFFLADGRPLNHDPRHLVPTQALAPIYEENSNLYVFTADSFAAAGSRIGLRPMFFPTPRHESVDIDTPDDWQAAERLAANLVWESESRQRIRLR